jgi:hypothetical protein
MTDWKQRLTGALEPDLRQADPRPLISAYHDMPFAIFHYPPEAEWEVRAEVKLLAIRLHAQAGKRITHISLAECMGAALDRTKLTAQRIEQAEKQSGLAKTIDMVHKVISERQRHPLDGLIFERMPTDGDPTRDIAFVSRVGAMFPFYRTSNLTEHLMGKVKIPIILFYPGHLNGPASLVFMGMTNDVNTSYRPKIY